MIKVYPGSYGTCPDCGKSTPIRINSLIGTMKNSPWEIDPRLVREILFSVKSHAADGKTTIQKKNEQTGNIEKVRVEGKLAYCAKCNKPANKLFWVELNEGLSDPLCKYCLQDHARKLEDQDGRVPAVKVYSYSTTLLSVQQALLVFEDGGGQDAVPEAAPSEGTLEGKDLF